EVLLAGGTAGVGAGLGVGAVGLLARPRARGPRRPGGPGGDVMGTRLSSSRLYGHLWGTPELDGLFDEPAMLQSWLDILAALARAQAALGIVPESSASAIGEAARVEALDLDYVAGQTRRTS